MRTAGDRLFVESRIIVAMRLPKAASYGEPRTNGGEVIMDALMLSRLQFAVATLFHFFFVPLTLGLSFLIAIMETQYVRTRDEEYKRMAKFWGKLFIINFVLGVV